MFLKYIFNHLSVQKKMKIVHKKGVMLGTRVKDGRKIYIYMINNLFVEICYMNDSPAELPETIKTLSGLDTLNQYLEREFKASF